MTNNELHAIAELENAVKAEMHNSNTDKMEIGEYKVTLVTVTTNRLDSKALQADIPELYNKYSKSSSYERFTVR